MSGVLARISRGGPDDVSTSRGYARYTADDVFIGSDLDGLIDCHWSEECSAQQRELQSALRSIVPRQKLAVLSMVRDEALYLAEWIAHYLSIGVDHIFVYTNDNRDGTDELLRWFSQNTPVTPLFTTVAPGINIQRKNYQHAVFLLPELRLYDWVLVVDADEFLVPAAHFDHSLPRMLDAAPPDAAAIVFPWLWRLWDRQFERTPGLLAERFKHAIPHVLFKSASRLRQVTSLCEIHVPRLENGAKLVDTAFAPVTADQIWTGSHKSFEGGWIDHFWGRSFEEFIIKKTRGDLLKIPSGEFQRKYETFFSWSAPYNDANRAPVPAPIVAGIKNGLEKFNRDQTFRSLVARAALLYDEHALSIRKNPEMVSLYQTLREKFQFSQLAAAIRG